MTSIPDIFGTMAYGPAPEAAAPAQAWLERHGRRFGLFIGGAWTTGDSESFDALYPATGKPLARLTQASPADVDRAVRAARAAQPAWWALGGHGRARYLYAIARQIQKHSRLFAVLESLDNGKPIRESRDIDVPLVARHFYYHAGWAQLMERELPDRGPVGVIGQIIPWNFPLLMLAWKIAPALAMGNTVVLKPAEFTSITALRFAELCEEIGLPAGVVNVVTGDGRTGEAIVAHPDIDKIAFTGSTEVGRIIRTATAGSGKKLSLELGGKSPFVVFPDADLDSVVEGVVDAIWFNQGQVCCAGSRLLVQESVAGKLTRKLQARMSTLRVGSPLDKAIDIGAIIARVQLERIDGLVKQGIAEGATCWQPELVLPSRGLYYKPTLLSNVHPTSIVAQQEIFGPVLAAMTFRTPQEAVQLANNTVYGLAASVWSESVNVALQAAAQIKAGVVWVNSTNLFDAACGFGGYRESGYGREGGREGLLEYLEPTWFKSAPNFAPNLAAGLNPVASSSSSAVPDVANPITNIDRTVKLYIGGKQARPDSGYSVPVYGLQGQLLGEAPLGNRKDIRNAVEAARKAEGWAKNTAHNRAQILFYIAENLSQRADEITKRLSAAIGEKQAPQEVQASIERLFSYAAWCDKFDGAVHNPPFRNISIAMNEPVGTVGVICPADSPLLGFFSLALPLICAGNTVVAVPSEKYPLITGDLYQVFETSDLPGGVINLVTGRSSELVKVLAEHDDLDAIWCYGEESLCSAAKALSAGNLKQVWTNEGRTIDWLETQQGEGRWFLQHAYQVKNIWVPYGE
jgi:aldehyde dehydrogenase (NAD+)